MNNTRHTSVIHLKPLEKTTREGSVVLGDMNRHYPAQAKERVFVASNNEEPVTLRSFRHVFIARLVSLMLIPAILLNFAGRAYAEEIVGVDAVAVTQEVILAQEPAPVEDAAVVESETTPILGNEEAPVEDASGVTGESDAVTPPEETTSEEVSETTPAEDPSSDNGGSVEGDTPPPPEDASAEGASSESIPPEGTSPHDASGSSGEAGTTSPEDASTEEASILDASSTDAISADDATSTDVLSEEPDEAIDESIPSETIANTEDAATLALREERYRQELRKQVEEEFMRGCISFEASGYYCLHAEHPTSDSADSEKIVTTVESAQGDGGDKEIFVVKNGKRTVLTSNSWDDTFPTQDISGEKFVWQGMVGGRWQIFTGDISGTGTPRVTQVTDSHDSNFNPKIDGEHLVWQGWADNNWEIFLATKRDDISPFAGEHLPEGNVLLNVGPEWKVERLTTNNEPDMFPSLHGDIVTWQAHEGDTWNVYAYSIAEETMTKLSSDGTKSENPRFMITWEERDEEGHSRLMSYDMSTGQRSNLTEEAKKVAGEPFREKYPAPISQPNQAALPVGGGSGTSTPLRGEDDAGGGNDLLP